MVFVLSSMILVLSSMVLVLVKSSMILAYDFGLVYVTVNKVDKMWWRFRLVVHCWSRQQSYSTLSRVSTEMGDHSRYTILVFNQATQANSA